MPDKEQGSSTDQPVSNLNQESVTSFRDRAMARLETESRPEPVEVVQQQDLQQEQEPQAHQPDDGDQKESDANTADQPDGALAEGVDDSNVETDERYQDDEDISPDQLRQRATEAEESLQSMQRDYTQKTQKLGEARREVADSLEQSRKVAAVYADRANAQVKRYENINWQQLQSTLDPQAYNQRVTEYRQIVTIRDRAVSEHEQVEELVRSQTDRLKNDQAEISRDVLHATVPGWGNELYGQIREHAVNNLDWTASEFDEITDYRVIRLIHGDLNIINRGKTVQQIQQGNQPKAPGGKNKGRSRGTDGRFRNAQQEHLANPGNKEATRNAFRERLRKERTGRRL